MQAGPRTIFLGRATKTARSERYGSSEEHAKLRPLSGERWILTVGASRTLAPLLLASCPNGRPIRSTRSVFHVEASAIPAGKQAAFTLPEKPSPPLTPFGPSDTFTAGMPSHASGVVCHISDPASIDTFSCKVIWPGKSSKSRIEKVLSSGQTGQGWHTMQRHPRTCATRESEMFSVRP